MNPAQTIPTLLGTIMFEQHVEELPLVRRHHHRSLNCGAMEEESVQGRMAPRARCTMRGGEWSDGATNSLEAKQSSPLASRSQHRSAPVATPSRHLLAPTTIVASSSRPLPHVPQVSVDPSQRLPSTITVTTLPSSRYEWCHHRRPPPTIFRTRDRLDKHRKCSPVHSEPQDAADDHPLVPSPVLLFCPKPLPSTTEHGEPLSSPSPQINAPSHRHAP
jgi:hypothetical protein